MKARLLALLVLLAALALPPRQVRRPLWRRRPSSST